MRFIFLLLSTLSLCSCSTLLEFSSPNDTTLGYTSKNDGSGKYVRQRIVPDHDNNIHIEIASPSKPYKEEQNVQPVKAEPYAQKTQITPSSQNEVKSRLGFSGASGRDEDVLHMGFEFEFDMMEDWITTRFGLSFLSSDYVYWGGTVGARGSIPNWKLSPYIGLEAYLGDHKTCSYEDIGGGDQLETCEKVFLGTLYTEMGARWDITPGTRIYIFTRGYSKVDQSIREDFIMFYGASLMFNL